MATYYQTDHEGALHPNQFAHFIDKHCQVASDRFAKVLNSYALFHLSFLVVLVGLLISSSFLLALQPSSMIFAISLSLFFLTLFSYVLILFYFDGKKSQEFFDIDQTFFMDCKKSLPLELSEKQIHQTLAKSLEKLATNLQQKHLYALSLPPFFFLEDTVITLRFWLHHKDIISMQEMLLKRAIREHLYMIRLQPTDLESHSLLAGAFISLSHTYQRSVLSHFPRSSLLQKLHSKEIYGDKAKLAASRAVEELKILDNLAPNDPWVHAQLASCFCFLEMREDEIREYEILSNIRPEDKEILLRLGLLYFQSGLNAKGLKIYEQLKKVDAKAAEELLIHYNAVYL